MKLLLFILLLTSCAPYPEIEVEQTMATLVSKKEYMDKCVLTWHIVSKNIDVTSYEQGGCERYKLGTNYLILFRR